MLKVTITGLPNAGKTTLAMLIEKTLRDHGFSVMTHDPDIHHGTHKPDLQEERIRALAQRSKQMSVIVETTQPEPSRLHPR